MAAMQRMKAIGISDEHTSAIVGLISEALTAAGDEAGARLRQVQAEQMSISEAIAEQQKEMANMLTSMGAEKDQIKKVVEQVHAEGVNTQALVAQIEAKAVGIETLMASLNTASEHAQKTLRDSYGGQIQTLEAKIRYEVDSINQRIGTTEQVVKDVGD